MVANIAQRILDENNYTVSDISIANLEYLIDNAADYINLMAGTAIADIAGGTLTGTENEIIVVKSLSTLMLRAYLDRGPNTAVSSLSVTSVLADPQYALFTKIVDAGIAKLTAVVLTVGVVAGDIPFGVGTDES